MDNINLSLYELKFLTYLKNLRETNAKISCKTKKEKTKPIPDISEVGQRDPVPMAIVFSRPSIITKENHQWFLILELNSFYSRSQNYPNFLIS